MPTNRDRCGRRNRWRGTCEGVRKKTSELAVQTVHKGTGAKGGWSAGKGPRWSVHKLLQQWNGWEKGGDRAGKGQWSKTGGKKGGKGKGKVAKVTPKFAGAAGKQDTLRQNCTKGIWNRSPNAVDEDKGDISEEVREDEDEDELHASCLLEESENEQWQEVISKKSKLKFELAHESLLSVENNSCGSPRKVIQVKDKLAEHQSHNEHRSRACHARRDVPASETGSHEHNK